ncbi:MAG: coenzyme F420-0:L-glutamate ligase [Sphingomonadales bacterium]|nr:coenzyme F420-0:L-glutamate ligase [Sphingomonadales bacterium]
MTAETPVRHQGLLVTPLVHLPLFAPGMALGRELLAAAARQGEALGAGDVLVVAQKIVSKCEGRAVRLGDMTPGEAAAKLVGATGRAAGLAQLILDESSEIMRASPAAIIARHRTGHVLANAGIDASNVEGGGDDTVLLWPRDPDASARALRAELAALSGAVPAVVIADSLGRAWRVGTVGTAIGCAGLAAIDDQRGGTDLFGRTLQATVIAVADAVAAMAVLAMGEAAEGTPAAIVRGAARWITVDDGPGMAPGLRPVEEDMFR